MLAAFAVFDSSAVSRDNEQDMPTITNYLSNDFLRIEIEINRTLPSPDIILWLLLDVGYTKAITLVLNSSKEIHGRGLR